MVIVVTHSREHKYPLQLWLKVREKASLWSKAGGGTAAPTHCAPPRKTSLEDSWDCRFPTPRGLTPVQVVISRSPLGYWLYRPEPYSHGDSHRPQRAMVSL